MAKPGGRSSLNRRKSSVICKPVCGRWKEARDERALLSPDPQAGSVPPPVCLHTAQIQAAGVRPGLTQEGNKSLRAPLSAGQHIVPVTHEHDMALHAHRVIHIRDGKVERDERIK